MSLLFFFYNMQICKTFQVFKSARWLECSTANSSQFNGLFNPPQRQEADIRLQNTNKYITTMLTYFWKDEMKLVYQTLELVVGTLCMAQALTTLMECN